MMAPSLLLPPHFWLVVLACALSLLLLWWMTLGARRWRRWRRLHLALAAVFAREEDLALDAQALARMRRAIIDATHAMQRLHEAPWVLAVRLEDPPTPLQPSSVDAAWCWRLRPKLTWIDWRLGPEPASSRAWLHALRELAQQRPRLPLDAVVMQIDASLLLMPSAALVRAATQWRQRITEAASLLRLNLPVILQVDGLEALEGYAVFHDALPHAVRRQAVGVRPLPPGPLEPTGAEQAALAFDSLSRRLHALRLGLLQQAPDAASRLAILRLTGQLQRLGPGIDQVATHLFVAREDARRLQWQGLYLCAAAWGRRPGLFEDELLDRLIPDLLGRSS